MSTGYTTSPLLQLLVYREVINHRYNTTISTLITYCGSDFQRYKIRSGELLSARHHRNCEPLFKTLEIFLQLISQNHWPNPQCNYFRYYPHILPQRSVTHQSTITTKMHIRLYFVKNRARAADISPSTSQVVQIISYGKKVHLHLLLRNRGSPKENHRIHAQIK